MQVGLSYIHYSMDITYGILMSTQIGLGLIGNLIYFWCLHKNRIISNPEPSIAPSNPRKLIESSKSANLNANRILSIRQENRFRLNPPKRNIYLYIKTLAISDFLFCVNSIAVPLIYLACYNTCHESFIYIFYSLKIGFPLMDFFNNYNYILRIFISLDRLWALVFPFSYRRIMTNSLIKYIIVLGFMVSFSVIIPYGWGYIPTKYIENKTNLILYNQLITKNILYKCLDLNLTHAKYRNLNNNSISCLNQTYIVIRYTHLVNPKLPWFVAYRKWSTFIMSFIPFTISIIANFVIIKKCYKISQNRMNLRRSNKAFTSIKVNILFKWFNKIVSNHSSIHNEVNLRMENSLPVIQKREFQITILMSALNIHYILSTIPMTLYILMYEPWKDTFSNKSELWFQNIAYLTKYGNNALSVYITLFFDPTIKTIFYDIFKKHCSFYN
ncbi:unnamed protein product [Gordionus sp. m RMFG-2023]